MRKMPNNATGYIQMVQRRWILFLGPIVLVPLFVFFVSRKLPRSYLSETTIQIQTQGVPSDVIKDSTQSDVKDRFQSISDMLLSRSRLLHIVNDLGLYKLPGVASRDEAVTKLRKSLTIAMENERVEKQDSALFRISYLAPNPHLAQDVTRELANVSISNNLEEREQRVEGTQTFMQSELDRARLDLQQNQERLDAFRKRNSGVLPEQAAANMQLLSQNQALALANSDAIDRGKQQRAYIQSMLDVEKAKPAAPGISPPDPLDLKVAQKREDLHAARQLYTDQHPDVLRLQNELVALQAQQTHPRPDSSQHLPTSATPAQQQLEGQLASLRLELADRTARQAAIEATLHDIEGRVQASPLIIGEFQRLESDYEASQKNFDRVAEKQHTSAMIAELEKAKGHELIRVIDPANLPLQPSSPNLKMIDLAGLGVGIILGLFLMVAVDLLDETFHTGEDLEVYLTLPLIAAVPRFNQTKISGGHA